MAHSSEAIIDRFLKFRWEESKAHYREIASIARKTCENMLITEGIKAEFKDRVKDKQRLKTKCLKRLNEGAKYDKDEDIIRDVKDLAGVRIGLYFPNQKANVSKLIQQHFKVLGEKDHTGEEHEGYIALHYYVQVKNPDEAGDFLPRIVEIQVMSVLMYAWSNVTHDISYKALSGRLSPQEKNILSGLGRHLSIGDWFLETFHDTYITRVEQENAAFANHFGLGAYLSKQFSSRIQQTEGGLKLGPVKTMHALLESIANVEASSLHQSGSQANAERQRLQLNTPKGLENIIKEIDLRDKPDSTVRKFGCEVTISVYLMDHIIFKYANTSDEDIQSFKIPYQSKLKIMISAMIWADELFPSNWALEDNLLCYGSPEDRSLVFWIYRHTEINEVVTGQEIDEEWEKMVISRVNSAWQFFRRITGKQQCDPIMTFAFRLALKVQCESPKEALIKLAKRQFLEDLPFPND